MTTLNTINAIVTPKKHLNVLSQAEINQLLDRSQGGSYDLFRKCALAVLSTGMEIDDGQELLRIFSEFDIEVMSTTHGVKLKLTHAPASAFVDGKIIKGISEHLFAVLRDVVYFQSAAAMHVGELVDNDAHQRTTDYVFQILRHAGIMERKAYSPRTVVCWGGHSISRHEYDYTKLVGYQIGLRHFNICTGCGMGAMKGPMKGATIAHAKQRLKSARYLGLTEMGIMAAEAPNPIVSDLIIFPDIEKRLEAFVRVAHAIVVFPGGVGTVEEILYLVGILLHPDNKALPFPVILTGPESAREYFEQLDYYIRRTLGDEAAEKYQIIIDDPVRVAQAVTYGVEVVNKHRKDAGDAYYFNWQLKIDSSYQQPFIPSHKNMRELQLSTNLPKEILAVNLRRLYSGIVSGNIKEFGLKEIATHGKFEISGDSSLMKMTDQLLVSMIEQQRMKLPGKQYEPCYQIINE